MLILATDSAANAAGALQKSDGAKRNGSRRTTYFRDVCGSPSANPGHGQKTSHGISQGGLSSHEACRASEEAWAGQLVARELKRLNLTEADLERRRKSDARKLRITWRLRRETTMSLNWIAKQLKLGAAGSQANLLRHGERN